MLTLVTGIPGSGKSSLVIYAKELQDSRFIDADDIHELCEWRKFDTGESIGLVSDVKTTDDENWHNEYGWYWKEESLTKLLREHPDVVICGSSENITDFFRLFDQIIILKKTQAELSSNLLQTDRSSTFGKTEEQRMDFIEWQDELIEAAKPYNPSIIPGNDTVNMYGKITKIIK